METKNDSSAVKVSDKKGFQEYSQSSSTSPAMQPEKSTREVTRRTINPTVVAGETKQKDIINKNCRSTSF